jgi:hypothetical protein
MPSEYGGRMGEGVGVESRATGHKPPGLYKPRISLSPPWGNETAFGGKEFSRRGQHGVKASIANLVWLVPQ